MLDAWLLDVPWTIAENLQPVAFRVTEIKRPGNTMIYWLYIVNARRVPYTISH